MAVSYQRYATAGAAQEHSSFMSQVANSQPRQVEKLYENFDYMEFVISNLIGKSEKAAYAVQQDFTDERYPPITDELAEDLDNSETGIDVTDGSKFQKYNVIQIDDERMWVSAEPSGNTLTVVRGGSIGSTAATHSNGATIYIVSSAAPENVGAIGSATARGVTVTNYMQLFMRGLKVSMRQEYGGSYLVGKGKAEGPSHEYAWELARQFRLLAREREMAAWRGQPFAGTGPSSTGLPSLMGGIPNSITENVLDLADQPFTPMQVMDQMQLAWNAGGPTGMARMVYAGAVARRALSSFYRVNIQQGPRDKVISLVADEVITDLGPLMLAEANFWIPPDIVVCMDPDNYKWRAWGGYGEVHKTDLPVDGPFKQGMLTADYTILCGGDRVSWKMTSVATDSTLYPSLNG